MTIITAEARLVTMSSSSSSSNVNWILYFSTMHTVEKEQKCVCLYLMLIVYLNDLVTRHYHHRYKWRLYTTFFHDDKHKTTITNNLSLSFFWPHQNHSKMIKKITFIHTLLLLLLTVKLLLHFHTFLLTVSLFECARATRTSVQVLCCNFVVFNAIHTISFNFYVMWM